MPWFGMIDMRFMTMTRQCAVTTNVGLFIVLMLCVGCPGPLPNRNLKEYVTKGDVVGTIDFGRLTLSR